MILKGNLRRDMKMSKVKPQMNGNPKSMNIIKLNHPLKKKKKEEYKKEFKSYKRQVHDTLQLVDFKYTLFHDRWSKLNNYKDYQFNNFHEMSQKTLASGDDNITKILLTRAQKQEKNLRNS